MKLAAPILAVAAALVLAGCSATTGTAEPAKTTAAHPSASPTVTFPSGEPPRNGAPDYTGPQSVVGPDSVPGLTAAIAAASHPGLQICSGNIVSQVFAQGDLRGNGGTQYLVDTTCDGATASSPEEVSLYDVKGGKVRRSAVIYETTANRPRTTAYPYIWKDHTVVLTYDGGDEYRLVELTPTSVVPGLVESFR